MNFKLKGKSNNPILTKDEITEEELVISFLEMNYRWFNNPSNGFYGYQTVFFNYCLYYIRRGEWGG